MRFALAFGVWALAIAPAFLASQGTAPPPPPTQIVFGLGPRGPRKLSDAVMTIPPDNPMSEAKSALGRRLFFDPLLSNDQTVSCATCHDPAKAFTDGKPIAVGVFGRVGRRNSPTLVNRGYGRNHFWDGRAATLEAQVVQPIGDPNEMDLPLDVAVDRLGKNASYRDAFQSIFGQPVSKDDLARALAGYLRTIRSEASPFDRFLDGDQDALTTDQKLGQQIFNGKARCTMCHVPPFFTAEQFENTGVAWQPPEGDAPGAYKDDGRFAVSGLERDRGKFKVPTLREIASTAPYMHDGSLATLADVVDFYDRGGRPNPNLMPMLVRPLGLTADEKQALIKFLESLSGTISGK